MKLDRIIRFGIVYMTTNLTSGNLYSDKSYVGSTINDRLNYLGSSVMLIRDVDEYGVEYFAKDILFLMLVITEEDRQDPLEIESAYIEAMGTLFPAGYNKKIKQWPPSLEDSKRGSLAGALSNKINGTGFNDPVNIVRSQATMKAKGLGVYNPENRAKGLRVLKAKGLGCYDPENTARIQAAQKENCTAIYNSAVKAKALAVRQRNARIRHWIYCAQPSRTRLPFKMIAERMRKILNGDVVIS